MQCSGEKKEDRSRSSLTGDIKYPWESGNAQIWLSHRHGTVCLIIIITTTIYFIIIIIYLFIFFLALAQNWCNVLTVQAIKQLASKLQHLKKAGAFYCRFNVFFLPITYKLKNDFTQKAGHFSMCCCEQVPKQKVQTQTDHKSHSFRIKRCPCSCR